MNLLCRFAFQHRFNMPLICFQVIGSRVDTFRDLVQSGEMALSYRYGVKPSAMKGIPRFTYAVLVEDSSVEPPTMIYERNLSAIPDHYLRPHPNDHRAVLRYEGETTLADIKKFHRKVATSLDMTEDAFKEQCSNLQFSVDGVKESGHAAR